MRVAFQPADFAQRARDRLEQCVQTGSVEAYTTAFRTRCWNVLTLMIARLYDILLVG